MTFARVFLFVSLLLFGSIGFLALIKKEKKSSLTKQENTYPENKQSASNNSNALLEEHSYEIDLAKVTQEPLSVQEHFQSTEKQTTLATDTASNHTQDANEVDRIAQLFQVDSPLPIVETITYKNLAPWKNGRPAWLIDYATHYKTSLDFISRSTHQKPVYTPPKNVKDGTKFTVLSQQKRFYFYLLVDVSRCDMWLYYVLPDTQECVFLKKYKVCLGRRNETEVSKSLTPIGKYLLGSRIAHYYPKIMGRYKGERTEMITVFGTRWIPFEKELDASCSKPAKSFGIHGTPWYYDKNGKLIEDINSIGKYESDGCIRLKSQDMEELFAIISTRKTIIELVKTVAKPVE